MKTRHGIELEGDREFVGSDGHVFGQQAVSGRRFVKIADQQGLEHQAVDRRRRRAFECEWVVFIKTGRARRRHHGDAAAFGGDRVDIGEMLEAGRVFDIAKLRIGMTCPGRIYQQAKNQSQKYSHATILQDFSGASTCNQNQGF